jgi:hypothetical protein
MNTTEKSLSPTTQMAWQSCHTVPPEATTGARALYYAYHLGQEVQRHHQHCLTWHGGIAQAVPYVTEGGEPLSGPNDGHP